MMPWNGCSRSRGTGAQHPWNAHINSCRPNIAAKAAPPWQVIAQPLGHFKDPAIFQRTAVNHNRGSGRGLTENRRTADRSRRLLRRKPSQLIGEARQPVPAAPGRLERFDYEPKEEKATAVPRSHVPECGLGQR